MTMTTLSEESRAELASVRAAVRAELRDRRSATVRKEEAERIARLAKQGRLITSELTRAGRFFASRAGDVWHLNVSCPALAICRDDEILYVGSPWTRPDLAERECLRCSTGVETA